MIYPLHWIAYPSGSIIIIVSNDFFIPVTMTMTMTMLYVAFMFYILDVIHAKCKVEKGTGDITGDVLLSQSVSMDKLSCLRIKI